MHATLILSGGMDSVVLAHKLAQEGYDISCVTFNYNQKHKKEIDYAQRCAFRLGAEFLLVDVSSVGLLLSGSSLTDNISVPDGHYSQQNMSITVVPNRNAILLSIAYGIAVSKYSDIVAIGVHTGDHFIYPDCRPNFVAAFETMQRYAIHGFGNPELSLYTPFIHMTKSDICTIGQQLCVPFEDTWSCYKGQDVHCGICGTCTEKKEAFLISGIDDPTVYLQ